MLLNAQMLRSRTSPGSVADGSAIRLLLKVEVGLLNDLLVIVVVLSVVQVVESDPSRGAGLGGTRIAGKLLVVLRERTQLLAGQGVAAEDGLEAFAEPEATSAFG